MIDRIVDALASHGIVSYCEEVPLKYDISQCTFPCAVISINQSNARQGFLTHQVLLRLYWPSSASAELNNYLKGAREALYLSNMFNAEAWATPIKNSSPLVSGAQVSMSILDESYGCKV